MNVNKSVCNGLKCVLLGFSLVAASGLRADTVAWWRFGDLGPEGGQTTDSMQFVNSVDATKHPAIPHSFSGYTAGTDPAYMPRLVKLENATSALTVYDPVSGVSHPFSTALSCPWGGNGTELSGGATVTGSPELTGNAEGQSGDITFECFFRTSQASMSRKASMAAIFAQKSKAGNGAMSLLVRDQYLWTRFAIHDGKDSPEQYDLWGTTKVTPDVWHHAAFVYDCSERTVCIYLDYRLEGTKTVTDVGDGNGRIYPYGDTAAIHLGKSPCANKDRSLAGEMAEARISDTALDVGQFLRFREYAAGDRAGDGDANTFMWHSFDSDAALQGSFMAANPLLVTAEYTNHYMIVKQANANPLAPVDDVLSATVRRSNPVLSDDPVPMLTNEASLAFVTNALKSGYLELNPLDNAIASDDFTMEFFYRTSHPVVKGQIKNSYALVCSSFAKILVDQSTSRLFCRFKCKGGSTDMTAGQGDDGQWHHVAFTYSKAEQVSRFYHNGKLVGSCEGELVVNGTSAFTIGYANDNSTPLTFDGRIDEFRLTRKTLSSREFMSTSPVTGRTLAWIRFENDMTAYPYGSSATAKKYTSDATGGKAPAFVGGRAAAIDLSNGGNERIADSGACRFDGGSAYWPRIMEIEKPNLTVEFFWRPFEVAASWPLVLGLSNEEGGSIAISSTSDTGKDFPWALYYNGAWSSTYLLVKFCTSDQGVKRNDSVRVSPNYKLKDSSAPSCGYSPITSGCDGRWHHVAMTLEEFEEESVRKTRVTTYWDYAQVDSTTVIGTLNLKDTGHWLTSGLNGQSSRLARWDIDEIRITNGILAPNEFIRKSRQGLFLVVE